MKHQYESELIEEIVDTRGHKESSLHYESECVETWIKEAKGAYPKLCDYESEWLNYISVLEDTGGSEDPEPPIGEFPYVVLSDVTEATVDNVVPYAYKSAILKGNTLVNLFEFTEPITVMSDRVRLFSTDNFKNNLLDGTYTLINVSNKKIGLDINDKSTNVWKKTVTLLGGQKTSVVFDNAYIKMASFSFSEGWTNDNLEEIKCSLVVLKGEHTNIDIPYFEGMQSVRMPVLTTSNEDGTKTNILTVNEDVTLRSNGDICDELNLLTGQLTQRIGEDGVVLSQEAVKTVELNIQDQNGKTLSVIKPIEGKMFLSTSSDTIKPLFSGEIPVEAITQNLASFIDLD